MTVVRQRVVVILILLTTALVSGLSTWSVNYGTDQAFLFLKNGQLISLPTNQSFSSPTEAGQHIKTLAQPPDDTTALAVTENILHAFRGSSCSTKDGSSLIQVSYYDQEQDSWQEISLDEANTKATNLNNITTWSSPSSSIISLYGGTCKSTISGRLLQYDTSQKAFINPSNQSHGPSPISLYAAGSAEISQGTFLVAGGKTTDNAWVGMDQVAIWQDGTWTFKAVENSKDIDSRTDALVLPVGSDSVASKVLVIGGDVVGRPAKPYVAQLALNEKTSWKWSTAVPDQQKFLGAITLFETLITIESSSTSLKAKRSSNDYTVNFYNANNWVKLESFDHPNSPPSSSASGATQGSSPSKSHSEVQSSGYSHHSSTFSASASSSASISPSASSHPSGGGLSKGTIAAISTVLPISVAFAAGVAVFFLRRTYGDKNDSQNQIRNLTLTPASSSASYDKFPSGQQPLESASLDSWNEKRKVYELQLDSDCRPISTCTTIPPQPPPHQSIPSMGDARTLTEFDPKDNDSSSDDDYFQGRDVQVLVSSQRRSRLVVANPGFQTNSDEERDD